MKFLIGFSVKVFDYIYYINSLMPWGRIPESVSYTFLSESIDCYKCLENKIESGFFGKMFDLERVNHAKLEDSIKWRIDVMLSAHPHERNGRLKRELLKAYMGIKVLPTRYDRPDTFITLDRLVKEIKKAAKKHKIDTRDFPLYSVLPTGKVNALAIKLECCTEAFLLFDSQLFTFCHLFSKAFMELVPILPEKDGYTGYGFEISTLSQELAKKPEKLARMYDLLFCFVQDGDPSKAEAYPVKEEIAGMVSILREGMELFVVGHEFGHVYGNHITSSFRKMLNEQSGFEEISESHHKEYEADFLGCILAVNAMYRNGMDPGMSLSGIYLFFIALELAEKMNHYLVNGSLQSYRAIVSETHPKLKDRKGFIKGMGINIFGNNSDVNESLKILEAFDDVEIYYGVYWKVIIKMSWQSNNYF